MVNVVNDKKKSEKRSKKGKGRRRERDSGSHMESGKFDEATKCRNCGGTYPHKDACPARNKCISCGKLNHFAKVCTTVPPDSVKRVTEEEGTADDDYVYAVGEKKQPMCILEIDGEYLEMMLDSGASVNLIDEVTYERIYKGKARTLEQATW